MKAEEFCHKGKNLSGDVILAMKIEYTQEIALNIQSSPNENETIENTDNAQNL